VKKRLAIFLVGSLIVALGAGTVLIRSPRGSSASYAVPRVVVAGEGTEMASANYAIPWDVVAAGGNEMASANYAIKGTAGQAAIGPGSSSNYAIGAGYWYERAETLYRIFLSMVLKEFAP
jgi:hypothetical protein